MQNNTIFLIVGNSGSGKTTVVNALCKHYGLKAIDSYTTRKPRYDGERGHIFVDIDDMPDKSEMVAYTYYKQHHYWATKQQVDENDLYVIDVPGIDFFKQAYHGPKQCKVIQLWAPEATCFERMVARGDTPEAAAARIEYDKEAFANVNADIIIFNDHLDKCITELADYIFED